MSPAEMARLYEQNHSLRSIAKLAGKPRNWVTRRLRAIGVPIKSRGGRRAKISPTLRSHIVDLYYTHKLSCAEVGKLVGLSHTGVHKILKRIGFSLRPATRKFYIILFLLTTLSAVIFTQQYTARPGWMRDDGWVFCRLQFDNKLFVDQSNGYISGIGWNTDFPLADINIMKRISELTTIRIDYRTERNTPEFARQGPYSIGEPRFYTIQPSLNTPALSTCPFIMATDVGKLTWDEVEVRNMRDYLIKGGFLWVDDFWGDSEWNSWVTEISRVLFPNNYPIQDLPRNHPIFTTPYLVEPWITQISHIAFWKTRRLTSEYGTKSASVNIRGIFDDHGRLMVLMTHNTDIGDIWEQESDEEYFDEFAVDGYSFGINVILYALTH